MSDPAMIRAVIDERLGDHARQTFKGLLAPAARDALHFDGSIWDTRSGDAGATPAFEGLYGRIYNRVIQSTMLRRVLFTLWGSTDPLHQLETFVADAVRHAATVEVPVIIDLPSGGGTLLPLFARSERQLVILEMDLAEVMLRRALAVHERTPSDLEVSFVRANALSLPLRDGVVDVVVSVNGLHVMPDPGAFLTEIARVLKPGGALWLITPVSGTGIRSRLILGAAHKLGVVSRPPPTLSGLEDLVISKGFERLHGYGGGSITGAAFRRA